METKTLGVLGAISSLVALPGMAVGAAVPFQPGVPTAQSYAELLEPIPNAVERLKIADAQNAAAQPILIKAQYFPHHHHHAHVIIRRYYRPHYSYRRNYYRYGYFPRVIPYVSPYYHHHHHHHHHHSNY